MSEPKPMPTYWSLAEEVTYLHGRLDQLEAENAKLRGLVDSMASRLRWADEITGGGVLDARLKRQLREVGVEVDG